MTTPESSMTAGGRWVNGQWLEGQELKRAIEDGELQPRTAATTGDGNRRFDLQRWEWAFYGLLLSVALLMRLWDLGSRAVHHDESLHGYFSYLFYSGDGFQHNPLMHGTFLFHMISGSFWLFGDNEYTMRLPMALFGAVLVLLPLLFRKRLGTAGAMTAALLLAFSPALLYYSRFARNDIFMAVFTLGLVIAMWRYLDEGRNRWLFLGAALLALGFVTKETQYIVVAILAGFLLLQARMDVWDWLMGRKSLREFGRAGGFLVMMMSITLPLYAAGISLIQEPLGITLAAPDGTPGMATGEPAEGWGYSVAIAFSVLFLVVGFAVGWLWKGREWLICWLIFAAIFATFYTSVFTHVGGVGSGTWQSLGYWIAQHDVRRGNQPWYYYFIVTSVYEFLPFLFAVVASGFYALRGSAFARFLVYWSVATFLAYTVAGEKMPWLLVNVTLPLIILTAKAANDIIVSVNWRRFLNNWGLLVIPAAPLFILLIWRLVFVQFNGFDWPRFLALWVLLAMLGFMALGLYQLASHIRWKPALGVGALAIALTLLLPLTVRAGWVASYHNGDIPREILVYTQTSPEIHRLAKQIEDLSNITEEGKELSIQIDGTGGYAWPWYWYLRHFERVSYPEYDRESQGVQLGASIYVINANNRAKVEERLPSSIGEGRRIVHRWWFPEDYRHGSGESGQMVPSDFFGTIPDRDRWRGAIDYFLYRELNNPLGTTDSYIYYDESLPLDAIQ